MNLDEFTGTATNTACIVKSQPTIIKQKKFQTDLEGNKVQLYDKIKLVDKFIIPPFSFLDTKQKYWQDRKAKWLSIIGSSLEKSREDTLYKSDGSFVLEKMTDIGSTSHFDPVLAEIIYKWFNVKNGKILDPFGGEQTKGVVAGVLDYPYTAVEFRQEQVDINIEACKSLQNIKYITGDSKNLDILIPEDNFDLCFTSPPYYDLEVYSKEDASAMGTYEEFMRFYKTVFTHVYNKLKNDRFLILKVTEIRNKNTGEYRNFIGDNISIMKDIGFKYYNEIILLNAIGTGMLRTRSFSITRKVVKLHQNILVFYKGNLDNIKNNFEVDENGI